MAINPNTDFTAGQVLTAAQQNRFPRGVMALNNITSSTGNTTAEATRSTLTFTAVANRYYRVHWYEPNMTTVGGSGTHTLRIRETSTTGTIIGESLNSISTAGFSNMTQCIAIKTFSAGSVTLLARVLSNGTVNLQASATQPAAFWVEDIGPA